MAVVACDSDHTMLAASTSASQLLGRFADSNHDARKLPASLVCGADDYMAAADQTGRRPTPVRVASVDDQTAVFVFAKRLERHGPVARVVWFHEEVLRDTALLAALQDQFGISAREFRLIQQIRLGHSNREVARTLGLTEATVKSYLHVLFEQLGVHSRMELVACVERIRRGK
jgi:DNA-binding CsgD family transcriptional regulator